MTDEPAYYRLMVSYNCGSSYDEDSRYDRLDDPRLITRTEKLDKDMLRWVIEDTNGNIVDVGRIHKNIIEMMSLLRRGEQ